MGLFIFVSFKEIILIWARVLSIKSPSISIFHLQNFLTTLQTKIQLLILRTHTNTHKRVKTHQMCGQKYHQCLSKCWFMTFWVKQAVISTFVHQFNEFFFCRPFSLFSLIFVFIFEANVWFCMSFFSPLFCLHRLCCDIVWLFFVLFCFFVRAFCCFFSFSTKVFIKCASFIRHYLIQY